MDDIKDIREKLKQLGNPTIAANYKRYLKSSYDFYGIRVPMLRKIAKQYKNLSIYDAYNLFDELWESGNHEEMNLGLYLLQNFKKNYGLDMWNFLLKRAERAKSWDQIDALGTGILGYIAAENPPLYGEIKRMAESKNPWIRRLSIVSNNVMIKKNKIELTLRLAEKLCYDEDIYVQKGAGWMLREAGKKNPASVQDFIILHKNMKPAAFSYATEKMLDLRKRIKEFKKGQKAKTEEKK